MANTIITLRSTNASPCSRTNACYPRHGAGYRSESFDTWKYEDSLPSVCFFSNFGWVGCIFLAELTQVSDTCMRFLQNPQKHRVWYGCCAERKKVSDTVGYRMWYTYPGYRYIFVYAAHRSFGYLYGTCTELTEVSGTHNSLSQNPRK